MPAISIVVPIYHIEAYLHQCVDSILAQTFTDFELILVDDGSPDGCPAICDEYAQKDSRIKVIHQENQGQAAARNHAVLQASGEYITFVDGDDVIHPQMLEILYRGVCENQAAIAMCRELEEYEPTADFDDFVEPSFRMLNMDDETLSRLIQSETYVYWAPWPKLIRRSIVLQYPFTVGRIYEDSAVVFRWLCEAETIADCDAKLYFYRINQNGTTKKAFSLKQLDKLWSWEQQIAFYETNGYEKCLDVVFHSYMFTVCDFCKKVKDELDRADIAKEIRKRALKTYKRCREKVSVSPYERDRWMEVLCPTRTKITWKLQSLFKKS